MSSRKQESSAPYLGRRELLSYTAAFGTAFLARQGLAAPDDVPAAAKQSLTGLAPKRYDMKKSINLWAFPYPDRMNLSQCLQLAKDAGFDGIELNYDLVNDLSPNSGTKEFHDIRREAEEEAGWRARQQELARQQAELDRRREAEEAQRRAEREELARWRAEETARQQAEAKARAEEEARQQAKPAAKTSRARQSAKADPLAEIKNALAAGTITGPEAIDRAYRLGFEAGEQARKAA